MKEVFARQLGEVRRGLVRHPSFAVLDVSYNDVVAGSTPELEKVIDFLGLDCTPEAMRRIVDPDLYRQRGSEPGSNPKPTPWKGH